MNILKFIAGILVPAFMAHGAVIDRVHKDDRAVTLKISKSESRSLGVGDEVTFLDEEDNELGFGEVIGKGKRKIKVAVDSGFKEVSRERRVSVVRDFEESSNQREDQDDQIWGRPSKFFGAHKAKKWGLGVHLFGVTSSSGLTTGLKGYRSLGRRSGLNSLVAYGRSQEPSRSQDLIANLQYTRFSPSGFYFSGGGGLRSHKSEFKSDSDRNQYSYETSTLFAMAGIGQQWIFESFIFDVEYASIGLPLMEQKSGSQMSDLALMDLPAEELDAHLDQYEASHGTHIMILGCSIGLRF